MKLLQGLREVSLSLLAPQTVSWLLFPAQHPTSPAGSCPSLQVLGQAPCCTVPLRHILSRAGGCSRAHPTHPSRKEREGIAGDSSSLREHKQSSPAYPPSLTPSFLHHWIDHTVRLYISTWLSPGLDPSKLPHRRPDRAG